MRRNILAALRMSSPRCVARPSAPTTSALLTAGAAAFAHNNPKADTTTATSTSTAATATSSPKPTLFKTPLRRRSPPAASASPAGEGVVDGGAAGAAEVTVGVRVGADDELARAYNRFAGSVGSCSDAELLLGAQQAYYSTAAVVNVLAENARPVPAALQLESAKIMAAAGEARELLDKELPAMETGDAAPPKKMSVGELEGRVGAVYNGEAALQNAQRRVVDKIMALLPISPHLAETLFKVWCLQKEKKANLYSIAGPTDYVLDTKMIVFARLDTAKIFVSDTSDSTAANFEVAFDPAYLRQKKPFVLEEEDGAMSETRVIFGPDGEARMEAVATPTQDSNASNASNASSSSSSNDINKVGNSKVGSDDAAPAASHAVNSTSADGGDNGSTSGGGLPTAAAAEDAVKATEEGGKKLGTTSTPAKEAEAAVRIKVDGKELPPIPAAAQACVLLSMDVVVPPERYARGYEWYYNRIIGHESEYERIAAARMFAQNSPRGLASFFDFVTRMFTGKPLEFMFSKTIGNMMGLPKNVDVCPPATRKLMCLYLDPAHRWVLSDLIPLHPVSSTPITTPSK